jgi:hypothetical protein
MFGLVLYFSIVNFPVHALWPAEEVRGFVNNRTGHEKVTERPICVKDFGSFFANPKRSLGVSVYRDRFVNRLDEVSLLTRDMNIVIPVYNKQYRHTRHCKTL